MLESLRDIPIVGDVRGAGYFHAIELVKDRDTKETLQRRGVRDAAARLPLAASCSSRGLICRADDRGDPVIQLSPPLIAGPEQFEEIEAVLRPVLEEASRRMGALTRRGSSEQRCSPSATSSPISTSASSPARTNLDAPVRWVHISELADPTPWLSGGELLLTTGMALDSAKAQRDFIARLADHGLAGLGFGTGFAHEKVPEALIEAAKRARLPAVRGPVRDARSSPSPSRPSRGWSTSSTRCCSARSPPRSASSGSCSPSAASTRSSLRSRR